MRFWVFGAACSVGPDLDVLGFWLGIPYDHLLGHRGLTHSLFFAALLAVGVVAAAFDGPEWSGARLRVWAYLFGATASHGILDAMTNGGLGVAFFAPFDSTRYFLPFRPIEVSPIGLGEFFTAYGWVVLASEIPWVWLPAVLFAAPLWLARRWRD
jgi:inner membrane protein